MTDRSWDQKQLEALQEEEMSPEDGRETKVFPIPSSDWRRRRWRRGGGDYTDFRDPLFQITRYCMAVGCSTSMKNITFRAITGAGTGGLMGVLITSLRMRVLGPASYLI